jgi:hypothetical protein
MTEEESTKIDLLYFVEHGVEAGDLADVIASAYTKNRYLSIFVEKSVR